MLRDLSRAWGFGALDELRKGALSLHTSRGCAGGMPEGGARCAGATSPRAGASWASLASSQCLRHSLPDHSPRTVQMPICNRKTIGPTAKAGMVVTAVDRDSSIWWQTPAQSGCCFSKAKCTLKGKIRGTDLRQACCLVPPCRTLLIQSLELPSKHHNCLFALTEITNIPKILKVASIFTTTS
jgi:hypothetical protein